MFPFLLLVLPILCNAGNSCCDQSRMGFVEFESLADFLHEPKTIEQHFTYDNETDVYSLDKHATLEFNSNHYYFDDNYEPFNNRTKVCVFKLFNHQDEIEHVVFDDGSRPSQVVFGCFYDQECCEVGCCEINKYIYFYFVYPGAAMLVILAYVSRLKREREARDEQIRNAMNERN